MGCMPVGISLRLRGLTSLLVSKDARRSKHGARSRAGFVRQCPGKLRISSSAERENESSGAVITSYPCDARNTLL